MLQAEAIRLVQKNQQVSDHHLSLGGFQLSPQEKLCNNLSATITTSELRPKLSVPCLANMNLANLSNYPVSFKPMRMDWEGYRERERARLEAEGNSR